MTTLLQMVQDTCGELGLARPAAVLSSSDQQVIQFLSLANRLGKDLVRDYEWQQLNKEYLFTTDAVTLTGTTTSGSRVITGISSTSGLSTDYSVSGTGITPWSQIASVDSATQVTLDQPATATGSVSITFAQTKYPLPSDFNKIIPQTEWDRTHHWPLMGPKSAQEWQFIKGGIISQGPRMRFRILGNRVQINPLPADSVSLAFEYMSGNWVTAADGTTAKAAFTSDDDTCAFDDSLFCAGLKMRFLMAKGLEYGYAQDAYLRALEKLTSQNQDAPTLSLSRRTGTIYIGTNNLPESNFGQQ